MISDAVLAEILSGFKAILRSIDDDDGASTAPWTVAHSRHGVVVKSRTVPWTPCMQWVGIGEVDASASVVFGLLSDASSRQKWDAVMAKYYSAKPLSKDLNADLTYTVTHPMVGGLIASREFIDIRILESPVAEDPKQHIMAWQSPPEDSDEFVKEFPVDTSGKLVRGLNYCGGIRVVEVDENRCRVEYMVHSDIRGSMPVWLVNKGTGGAIDTIFSSVKKELSGKK